MAPKKNLCPVCGKEVCPVCGWAVPSEYRTLMQYRHAYTPASYHEDDGVAAAALRTFRGSISPGEDCPGHAGDGLGETKTRISL